MRTFIVFAMNHRVILRDIAGGDFSVSVNQLLIKHLIMSSNSISTIVKMVESLPDDLQDRVVEQVRVYVADLEEEAKWEASFQRTRSNLVAAARQAKREIAEGKAVPMDYDQL
jgi:hypothetical protein